MKRFAFWPLLALGCALIGSAIESPDADKGSLAGLCIGLALSIPVAYRIDRHRQRERAAGRRPPL